MKQETLITAFRKASLHAIVLLSLCGCGKDDGQIPGLPTTESCPLKIGTVKIAPASTAQTRYVAVESPPSEMSIYVIHPGNTVGRWGKYVIANGTWECASTDPIFIDRMGRSVMTVAFSSSENLKMIENKETAGFGVSRFRIWPEENIYYYNFKNSLDPKIPLQLAMQSIFARWEIFLSVTQDADITQFRSNAGGGYIFTAQKLKDHAEYDYGKEASNGHGTWKRDYDNNQDWIYPLNINMGNGNSYEVISILVPACPEVLTHSKMWLTIDGNELEIPIKNLAAASLTTMNYSTKIPLTLDNGRLTLGTVNTGDWPDPGAADNQITPPASW